MRREQHRAGDDQRVLIFLADRLPVRDVGEQPLVRLEILLVLDASAAAAASASAGPAPVAAPLPADVAAAGVVRSAVGRLVLILRDLDAAACTSASITLSDDFVRSWLRSRRTVSWFVSTSSVPPATKPATSTRWNGRDVQLGLDRRFDRDLERSRAAGDSVAAPHGRQRATSARLLAFVFAGARRGH